MPVKAASYDVQSRDSGIDSIGHVAAWLQYPKDSQRPSTTCPAQHRALTPSCPSCDKVMVRVHIPDPAHRGRCVANACRAFSQTKRARERGGVPMPRLNPPSLTEIKRWPARTSESCTCSWSHADPRFMGPDSTFSFCCKMLLLGRGAPSQGLAVLTQASFPFDVKVILARMGRGLV